jgi:hypothetical protein
VEPENVGFQIRSLRQIPCMIRSSGPAFAGSDGLSGERHRTCCYDASGFGVDQCETKCADRPATARPADLPGAVHEQGRIRDERRSDRSCGTGASMGGGADRPARAVRDNPDRPAAADRPGGLPGGRKRRSKWMAAIGLRPTRCRTGPGRIDLQAPRALAPAIRPSGRLAAAARRAPCGKQTPHIQAIAILSVMSILAGSGRNAAPCPDGRRTRR